MGEQIQDGALIEQVLRGNQRSYALLVDRYQHYVFTLVMRYVPAREEAEEVAQDVFIKAYRSLADFRGQSKFSTWLYTIVNTTCISWLRKKKERSVFVEEDQMAAIAERTGLMDKPSDYSEKRSERQLVGNAIRQLPETDAQVITLFYQNEQTIEEIGMILGLAPGNVKVKLFRARQKLKDILQQRYARELPQEHRQ